MPDVTVLLRVDLDAAEERGQQRRDGAGTARTGSSPRASSFQRRSPPPTTSSPTRHPDRIVVVDGDGTPGEVHARVMEVVRSR